MIMGDRPSVPGTLPWLRQQLLEVVLRRLPCSAGLYCLRQCLLQDAAADADGLPVAGSHRRLQFWV